MPPFEPSRLQLAGKHLHTLKTLLASCAPHAEVWAYGSRVTGGAHEGSDLDLVLRNPADLTQDVEGWMDLKEALQNSALPMLVDVHLWSRLPASFHRNIEAGYVVVQAGGRGLGMGGEWKKCTLGDLTVNHDGKRKPVKESDRRPGPYPYYGASGIVDYVDGYLFDGDYLLIAEDGENLRTRQTPVAFMARGKSWVNNHAHIVTGNDKADTRFLMYAIAATDISGYLTGAVMPKLTQGNLNKIELDCPLLPEQRAIAHILGTLDDKIELNRKQNETLEAMARALFKAWFVDFEPVRAKQEGRWQRGQSLPGLPAHLYDLFPDRLVDSELGEIPEGWRIGSIYDIADVRYGAPFASSKFNSNGSGLPLVRIRDLRDERPGVWTPEVHPKGYLIQPGDIVVGMDGEFRAYLWGGDPAWMNQRICAFHSRPPYCPVFVRNAIEPHLARVEATEIATTVIHLGKGDIDEFRVVIPKDNVAREFERICQPLFDKIVLSKQQSAILAALRDTLLPKLISGELRIADAEKFVGRAS